jgi:hypothetical protein
VLYLNHFRNQFSWHRRLKKVMCFFLFNILADCRMTCKIVLVINGDPLLRLIMGENVSHCPFNYFFTNSRNVNDAAEMVSAVSNAKNFLFKKILQVYCFL